jgi:hypothetical protein
MFSDRNMRLSIFKSVKRIIMTIRYLNDKVRPSFDLFIKFPIHEHTLTGSVSDTK